MDSLDPIVDHLNVIQEGEAYDFLPKSISRIFRHTAF
jgi:hypothetical protein